MSAKKQVTPSQLKMTARTWMVKTGTNRDLLEFMIPVRLACGIVGSFMTQTSTDEQQLIFKRTFRDLDTASMAAPMSVSKPSAGNLITAAVAIDDYLTASVLRNKSVYWCTAALYQFLARMAYTDYIRIEQRSVFNRALTVIREEFSDCIPTTNTAAQEEFTAGTTTLGEPIFKALQDLDLFRIDYLDIPIPADFNPRDHLPVYE